MYKLDLHLGMQCKDHAYLDLVEEIDYQVDI